MDINEFYFRTIVVDVKLSRNKEHTQNSLAKKNSCLEVYDIGVCKLLTRYLEIYMYS